MELDRRELLKGAVLTAATTGAFAYAAETSRAKETDSRTSPAVETRRPWEIIDTNVHLFQWPFRKLPYDTTAAFVSKLQSLRIKQAWAGNFEGVLHRDLDGVNSRLAEACRDAPPGLLIPFGSVNPELPDWEEDLRRCHETHHMPGIRLHPNYHGYSLSDPRFARLLAMAAERDLCVQIAVALEDRRTQHPRLQVPDVDLDPLPEVMRQVADAKVMLLNYRPSTASLERVGRVPGIFFDTARVEATDGILRLIRAVSPERVMLGSHSPLLVMEAALIKVYESELNHSEIGRLVSLNAMQMLSS